jgi:hypothetical protein
VLLVEDKIVAVVDMTVEYLNYQLMVDLLVNQMHQPAIVVVVVAGVVVD